MVNTLNPPISVIVSWPKANYVDPYDQGPALFICCIAFSIIGVFLVTARVYSRIFLTRAPGSDDYLIVVGCLLTIALSTLIAIANKKYFTGRHIWDVPFLETGTPHRLNIWFCEWLYLTGSACIKISILLFYRRMSVAFSKGFLIATWAGIVYNILVVLAFCICLLALCQPIEAYWKQFDLMWVATHKFHCITEQITLPLSGGLSMLGDIYATVLPMYMISLVPRSPRQKIGLYALFSLGFVSAICGLIRTYLMNRIVNVDYDFYPPLYWTWIVTLIELYFAIFAASAPALKPFFKQYVLVPVSKAKSSGVGSTNRNTTGRTPGTWNSSAPWSHVSSNRESGMVDVEKIGIAHGFPEKIQPGTHTTWVELKGDCEYQQPRQIQSRHYSKMISFPEERPLSFDEIAIAR